MSKQTGGKRRKRNTNNRFRKYKKSNQTKKSERFDIVKLATMNDEERGTFASDLLDIEKCFVELSKPLELNHRLGFMRNVIFGVKLTSDEGDKRAMHNGLSKVIGKNNSLNEWMHSQIESYQSVLLENRAMANGATDFLTMMDCHNKGKMNKDDLLSFRFSKSAIITRKQLKEIGEFDTSYTIKSSGKMRYSAPKGETFNNKTYAKRIDVMWHDSTRDQIPNFWVSKTWSETLMLSVRRMFMPIDKNRCITWLVIFGDAPHIKNISHQAHIFTKWDVPTLEEAKPIIQRHKELLNETTDLGRTEVLDSGSLVTRQLTDLEIDYENFSKRNVA